jgi:hypothetical protein
MFERVFQKILGSDLLLVQHFVARFALIVRKVCEPAAEHPAVFRLAVAGASEVQRKRLRPYRQCVVKTFTSLQCAPSSQSAV